MASPSSKPRLWIVTELYYPELTSTGYYLTTIAEYLTNEFDVKVICGQPNYSARGHIAPRRETRNDVEIFRVGGLRLNKNVLVFRFVNMCVFGVGVLVRALRLLRNGDKLLVVTTPPLLPAVATAAGLTRGAGYTLLVHDVYPEQLIATGLLRTSSLFVAVIERLNMWTYKHAERIITVGRDMQEVLQKKVAGLGIPVSYVPNWAETASITQRSRNEVSLLRELGLEEKFVVLYAGNFGRPNDLETVIDAASRMKSDPIHFLFIGSGAREKWLREQVAQLDLRNVTILASKPRDQQNEFLNACDVTIVPFIRSMWGAAVPSRIYNYMAAGKPIIAVCEPASEIARVVEEEQIGALVEPGDVPGLIGVLTEMVRSREDRAAMGRRARAAAESTYSSDLVLPRFRQALAGYPVIAGSVDCVRE